MLKKTVTESGIYSFLGENKLYLDAHVFTLIYITEFSSKHRWIEVIQGMGIQTSPVNCDFYPSIQQSHRRTNTRCASAGQPMSTFPNHGIALGRLDDEWQAETRCVAPRRATVAEFCP